MSGVLSGLIGSFVTATAKSYESIATAAGGVGTITFNNIPGTFTHLQIRIVGRNGNAGTEFGNIDVRFNNDSAANYSDHYFYGDGSTKAANANVTSRTLIGITANPCNSLQSNSFGASIIDILDYKDTNKYKTVRAIWGGDFNGSGQSGITSGNWRSTSAITRIDLISYGGTTFNSNAKISLYGIKAA